MDPLCNMYLKIRVIIIFVVATESPVLVLTSNSVGVAVIIIVNNASYPSSNLNLLVSF